MTKTATTDPWSGAEYHLVGRYRREIEGVARSLTDIKTYFNPRTRCVEFYRPNGCVYAQVKVTRDEHGGHRTTVMTSSQDGILHKEVHLMARLHELGLPNVHMGMP